MKYTVVDILNKFLAFTRFCKSVLLRELNKQQPFLNKDIFLTSCFASFCRQKLSWRHSYASVSCDYVNNEIRLWEKKNKLCLAFYTMRCYKTLLAFIGIFPYQEGLLKQASPHRSHSYRKCHFQSRYSIYLRKCSSKTMN